MRYSAFGIRQNEAHTERVAGSIEDPVDRRDPRLDRLADGWSQVTGATSPTVSKSKSEVGGNASMKRVWGSVRVPT